jgi:starvation-inducible outer membrane lipoprotein
MFRLWGKIVTNNKIITDDVFETKILNLSAEEKIKQGLEALCYNFDIQNPMWFSDNNNITMVGKTRFIDHHFIEDIDFDYFEIEIIEDED